VSIGSLIILVEEMWFLGEMALLESALYFFNALLCFGKWYFFWILQWLPQSKTRGSFVSFVLYHCHGGP
jgi:Kef-type K+ transport system membrane component KefB